MGVGASRVIIAQAGKALSNYTNKGENRATTGQKEGRALEKHKNNVDSKGRESSNNRSQTRESSRKA